MRKFIQNKKFILLLILLGIFSFNPMALATRVLRLQTEWPVAPGQAVLDEASNVTALARYLYEWGIALGGIIAFVALLIAGFHYLTSVGDPGKMKEAMNRIKAAIGGLILLLGSWLILHTINPELTYFREIDFKPENMPTMDIIGEEDLAQFNPCSYALLFPDAGFEGDSQKVAPPKKSAIGHGEKFKFKPESFVFCKEIGCRPIRCRKLREGESREWRDFMCDDHGYEKGKYTIIKSDLEKIEKGYTAKYKCPPAHLPKTIPRRNDICQREGESSLMEGGACSLQIFDGGGFFGWGCGGPVIELHGPRVANIGNVMAIEDIKCLELVKFTF